MRVLAQNPELTETDRARFVDPDQATRRLMKLEIEKSDGGLPEIDLIRHEEWIRAAGAVHGGQIYLDMPELGAKGLARVLHIGQCPKIESGEGQAVVRVASSRQAVGHCSLWDNDGATCKRPPARLLTAGLDFWF